MKKISDITSYVDDNGEFTDGDVPAGVLPTPLLAAWFSMIQRELVKVVESAGLTLDPEDDTQLWQALLKYFASQENVNTAINALGTMAGQDSDAVDITGGAITGTSLTGDLTGNADTATKLKTARTIGGVSFDGSASINLPGVNATGNQSTSGNAATATKLQTARKINNVAFDGTSDITITATDSSSITGVRLGSVSSYSPSGNEVSWTQNLASGNVMTGIIVQDTGSNSSDNIGGIYYRQVQYCINGTWYSATSL
ncbi:TPA: phage tail protein [Escherichia coli]|nr:phage tail protein [Escherichia coli]HAY0385869.1 phage tail protein [Escherichia coli]HEM0054162.1 phage tail protein [Escherichia coli]